MYEHGTGIVFIDSRPHVTVAVMSKLVISYEI